MAMVPPEDGSAPVLELKGRMATLTVVRVQTTDLDALRSELEKKLQEAPNLLRGAPMLIELTEGIDEKSLGLQRLASAMRELGAVPVAVRGGGVDESVARAVGLGVIGTEGETQKRESGQPKGRASQPPEGHEAQSTVPTTEGGVASGGAVATGEVAGEIFREALPPRVIDHPVRSGQQVYARGRDIVVLGAVGTGAEILADGDIHIYGALRGRALAGVQGDPQARIFCMALEAELVAVAGNYQVSERFETEARGRPAQISLDESGAMRIETFGKSG